MIDVVEIKFRVRGKMPSQERIRTHFYTLEELMNYSIPRGFIVESIDRYVDTINGREIYEEDIIKYQKYDGGWNHIGVIKWIGANCFGYYVKNRVVENKEKTVWWRASLGDVAECKSVEIIGNTYDDAHLLEDD